MKQGLLTVVLLALMAAPCVAEDWSTEITMEQIRVQLEGGMEQVKLLLSEFVSAA